MRVLNKSTMMIAALLVLAACQADEKQNKPQASVPQTAVSQPAPPVAQTKNTIPETPAPPTSKKEAVPTNVSKPNAAVQARIQQAKADAAAREQMGIQLAAAMQAEAMKKKVVKPVAEKSIAAKEPMPTGDASRGKKLAKKCVVCHDFGRRNKMGPGLLGVFDRQAGTSSGYRYTYVAFIAEGKAWRWDAEHLAAWLCDSKAAVRAFTGNPAAKTRMPAQRICDAAKQRDIIAYLKTL